MQRLIHGCLLAALVATGGGFTAVVQAVAWAGMMVRYSQKCHWSEALELTFNGENPCELCNRVSVAESKNSPPSPGEDCGNLRSFDLFPTNQPDLPVPVEGSHSFPARPDLRPDSAFPELSLPPPEVV